MLNYGALLWALIFLAAPDPCFSAKAFTELRGHFTPVSPIRHQQIACLARRRPEISRRENLGSNLRKNGFMRVLRRLSAPAKNRKMVVSVYAEDELAFNGTESIEYARRARARAMNEPDFRLLPVFPLHDEVVFPDGRVSLRLYEERYLKLFSTILYGEEEIDEKMAETRSPYLSTGRFGIVWRTPSKVPGVPGLLAGTGVAMKVISHEWLSPDQLIVNARGYKRFKVKEVIRSEPVLEARVKTEDEKTLTPDRLQAERDLSQRLIRVCDGVRKLSAEKAMRRATFSMEERMRVLTKLSLNETSMMKLTGEELSYWIAVNMFDSLVQQQEMLQLPTPRRLRFQMELLSETQDNLIQEAARYLNSTHD